MAVAPDGSVYVWSSYQAHKLDPSGSLVASFGDSGTVYMGSDASGSAVIDEEGNFYFAVRSGVAKVDRNGRPDPAFGSGGRTSLPFDSLGVSSWRLTRDPAGNLYVLGSVPTGNTYAAKFDAQGQLVVGYGDGTGLGAAGLHPDSSGMWIVDSSGGAFVAESINDPGNDARRLAVARLDNKAALVNDFAVGGFWTLGSCKLLTGASLGVGVDGNVIGVATCTDSTSYYPELFKLDSRGNPIAGFQSGPRRGLLQGAPHEFPFVLAVGARSELYVGGQRDSASPPCLEAVVSKLDSNGNAATAFGAGGVLALPSGLTSYVTAIGSDAAGRLYVSVAVGSCNVFTHMAPSFHIYRVGG